MSVILALNSLLILIIILSLLLMSNFSLYFISLKVFSLGVFSDLEFLLSVWNLLFLILVLVISMSVLFFTFSYMHNVKVINFILLYLSFVFSMSWLILNNNFYWMMLGWDGSGVVSFLLIIYYSNLESVTNGFFTLFQNRLGDLFFVLFLVGVINLSMASALFLKWGVLCLILGSAVKSAQFPFNAWLLSAMSAPTPISSLVHSSTLVVAGVYILLQYSYCLSETLIALKFLSLLTLMVSCWGLLNELDMKKLIAFSTMSHVSLMMFMLSQQLFKIVYFHLSMHAMFKSLMFMAFGFLMMASAHSQDKRLISYNSLNSHLLGAYYFSCLCLAGLPFLTGFFSKDFILEKFIETSGSFVESFLLVIFLGISIYYSMKLLMLNYPMHVQVLCEKQHFGGWSLFLMIFINIFMINIYISLVFSISLELMSVKFFIYLVMLILFMMSILFNFNLKMPTYSKTLNLWDLKISNFYKLDLYIYFTMFDLMSLVNSSSQIKLILVSNWWVMILFVCIF